MIELVRPDAKGLAIIFLYIVFFLEAVIIEPNTISVTENSFDILDGSEPVRIAFISDIHIGMQSEGHLPKVVEKINALEPDIVLIGGDTIDAGGWELDRLDALAKLEARTYAVLGNHDYGSWGCPPTEGALSLADEVEDVFEGYGIEVLRNEHEILEIRGKRFALIGVDDQWVCRDDYATASAGLGNDIPKVVLAHNELAIDAEDIRGKSVVFSGHSHCGQIQVPVITRFFLGPGFGDVVGGRASLDEDTDIYVTCGITQGVVRFLAPPEISVITID